MSGSEQLFGEHRNPEEIRDDIRETTAELTETLGALQDKLAPEALVNEAKLEVREHAMAVVAQARQHPAISAVIGAGALFAIGRALFTRGGRSSVASLLLGAALGAAAYRLLAGDVILEENEADANVTQDFSELTAPPTRAVLE
jgi:hypothetical protein